ncbi:hypothetical protein DdX_19416 [Ditylenchus destructor]|uniref:Uncharacterized protein n=1 Tax=Ditylenchus destructor TaxID=166010 RepID=A0AAD4MN79_9BILA|nr:hypothetical protein DdX_19416 [Ditylenchus destructor]
MPQEGWAGPMSAGLSIVLTQNAGLADSRVAANTQPTVNWPDPKNAGLARSMLDRLCPMNAALAQERWSGRRILDYPRTLDRTETEAGSDQI